jgi:hypothetical protein
MYVLRNEDRARLDAHPNSVPIAAVGRQRWPKMFVRKTLLTQLLIDSKSATGKHNSFPCQNGFFFPLTLDQDTSYCAVYHFE